MRQLIAKVAFLRYLYGRLYWLHYLKEKRAARHIETSFANSEEDLIVQRYLGNVSFFIDIGASGGKVGSNTFYFAIRGARGVCFEPVRRTFRMLRCLYLFNPRVICINCAISDKNAEGEIVESGDWSLIPETEDLHHSKLNPSQGRRKISRIKLLTFQEATQKVNLPRVIDLLSVDVEGHELNVLRSIPFERHHFRLIIVETHKVDAKGEHIWKHRDFGAINDLLAKNGYHQLSRTGVNTLYHPRA